MESLVERVVGTVTEVQALASELARGPAHEVADGLQRWLALGAHWIGVNEGGKAG